MKTKGRNVLSPNSTNNEEQLVRPVLITGSFKIKHRTCRTYRT